RLDPVAFQGCFRAWIAAACEALHLPHVAIDGKTLRHSGSASLGPLHVVSAWATANHLALGEVAVAEKSNEITAIPRLLELLDVNVIGLCTSERTVQGQTSVEVRYFIGSRRASAKAYGQALRGHWGIENGLHWHMDINFGEDASRLQRRRGAENFAVLRRIAL